MQILHRKIFLLLSIVCIQNEIKAQDIYFQDSITFIPHASFDSVNKFHRFLFGNNYRKDYAIPVRFPIIKISEFKGGLVTEKMGGGNQSRTLRLKDKEGKEWVLRSVDKYPEVILPEQLQESFAASWLNDAISAQYPYAALVVPIIAQAAKVPHANPTIGFIAPDKNIGIYSNQFSNKLGLIEEREPWGKSVSTIEMLQDLNTDNDNSVDKNIFLRARILDLFLGDWDRHDDQWRWVDMAKGKEKKYVVVPRDRDQVFHLTEGWLPKKLARPWKMPFLHHFDGEIKKANAFFYEGRNLNARLLTEFNLQQWQSITRDVTNAFTDSVMEKALNALPGKAYQLRHDELFKKWRIRRKNLPATMGAYHHFLNSIVDIQTSDKNELVEIIGEQNKQLNISIFKISKEGKKENLLFNRIFDEAVTKEVRLYIKDGKDSLYVNNNSANVKLRIIGGNDRKVYNIQNSTKKIHVYESIDNAVFQHGSKKIVKHLSNDSMYTRFIPVNLFNVTGPLLAGGYNLDDGIVLGAGIKHIQQGGFRKSPYSSMHQFTAVHSFSTRAYQIKYKGEWLGIIGNTDLLMQAQVNAPGNTLNYFGRGNETPFNKSSDFLYYYRTRYSSYLLDQSLRWQGKKGTSLQVGPSLYYYTYFAEDNQGRFISTTSHIGTYDSLTINENKLHLGINTIFTNDKRNDKLIPTSGSLISMRLLAYKGMGIYAADFARIQPEIVWYKSLNQKSSIILAERMGANIGLGKTTFYQSAFLGGQGNLLGYRQYRFAGQHSFYNNLELRLKLADVASYIVPGQYGITLFWDAGRIWEGNEISSKWHHGAGAGFYFSPASLFVFNFVIGHSEEGWLPYFTFGFRF